MRIALINSLYSPAQVGGAELTVQTIAEGLSKAGATVLVITLSTESTESKCRINGVEIVRIPVPNIYCPFPHSNATPPSKALWHSIDIYNPRAKSTILSILDKFAPDLVQTHNLTGFSTSAWAAIREMKVPIVHILHDYSLLCFRNTMIRRGRNCGGGCAMCTLARFPKRLQSSSVNAVVGVSKFVLNKHLEEGFFPNATEKVVIHNTYEPTVTAEAKPSSLTLPLRVGYLGSVSHHKGVEVLLKAASRLERSSIKLLIAGSGKKEYLARLRSDYPSENIQFSGRVVPAKLFSEIDLLVVPSIWNEPFGRVTIEAFAHGIPVFGTSAGGTSEIISDKVNGRIFPPDDPEALENLLRQTIEDPSVLGPLSVAALANKSKFYTASAIEKFANLHCNILDRPRSSGLSRKGAKLSGSSTDRSI